MLPASCEVWFSLMPQMNCITFFLIFQLCQNTPHVSKAIFSKSNWHSPTTDIAKVIFCVHVSKFHSGGHFKNLILKIFCSHDVLYKIENPHCVWVCNLQNIANALMLFFIIFQAGNQKCLITVCSHCPSHQVGVWACFLIDWSFEHFKIGFLWIVCFSLTIVNPNDKVMSIQFQNFASTRILETSQKASNLLMKMICNVIEKNWSKPISLACFSLCSHCNSLCFHLIFARSNKECRRGNCSSKNSWLWPKYWPCLQNWHGDVNKRN